MGGTVATFFRSTALYESLRELAVKRAERGAVGAWEQQGRPAPPPHVIKQQVLADLSGRYGLRVLVETGTYYGDMVAAMLPHFDLIYSVELSDDLYKRAQRRFRRQERVRLIHGDSAVALALIVDELQQPALFWLDGHYSGGETAKGAFETPILAELEQVLAADQQHVIVIDDARLFGTDPAYPTIEELRTYVHERRENLDVTVDLDSIRVTPSGA
jgi:hypothetical protein